MKNIKILIVFILGMLAMYGISNAYKLNASLVTYDKKNTTLESENVQGAIDELGLLVVTEVNKLLKEIDDGKQTIANSITEKGVETSSDSTFEDMANNIKLINGSDASVLKTSVASNNASNYTSTTSFTIEDDGKYIFYLLGCAYSNCSVTLTVNGTSQVVNTIWSGKPLYDMANLAVSNVIECKKGDTITATVIGSINDSAWNNYIIISPVKL